MTTNLSDFFYPLLKRVFPSTYKVQTLTYYIPAPPKRASGYREKNFDRMFYEFINLGFEIIHFSTQSQSSSTHSGMWIVFVLRAKNKKAAQLDLENYFSPDNLDNEIELK